MYHASVVGLQLRLAIMEAHALSIPPVLLLNSFLPLGGAEAYVYLYLLSGTGG